MIDLKNETILTFPEALDYIPGRPHISTLHRWRTRGVRGVKLETIRLGGKRATSVEALDRFYAAVDRRGNSNRTKEFSQSCRSQIQRAEEHLNDAGI